MEIPLDELEVLVQSEDRPRQQERLRHIVEQPRGHVVDLDHLIRHQRDTARNEQHRTGVLRDFEALVALQDFVGLLTVFLFRLFHGRGRNQ